MLGSILGGTMKRHKKMAGGMPEMPEDIKKIVHKIDSKIKLSEEEKDKIADWEDRNGGFAGMGIFV